MQVMREGSDITILGFSKMVGYCLQAAEELAKEGISCEVCTACILYYGRLSCCNHGFAIEDALLDMCIRRGHVHTVWILQL